MRINLRDVNSYKIMTHCLIVIAYLIRRVRGFCKFKNLFWVLQSNSPFLHPIPRLDWCNGQTVISEKFTGFTKIPLLAKLSSISVSTPENCKKRLWPLISLLHDDRDIVWVDWCLARSSAPQTPPAISIKEQDILFLLELKQPLSLFLSPTIIALLFFVYFR